VVADHNLWREKQRHLGIFTTNKVEMLKLLPVDYTVMFVYP